MTEHTNADFHQFTDDYCRYFTRRYLKKFSDTRFRIPSRWSIFYQAMLFVKMEVTIIEGWLFVLPIGGQRHEKYGKIWTSTKYHPIRSWTPWKNTWEIRGCHIRNPKLSPKKRAMIGIQSKLLTREARLKEQKKSQESNLEALLIILNQKKIKTM